MSSSEDIKKEQGFQRERMHKIFGKVTELSTKVEDMEQEIKTIKKELKEKVNWKIFSLGLTVLITIVGGMCGLVYDGMVELKKSQDSMSTKQGEMNREVGVIGEAISNLEEKYSFDLN